MQLSGMNFVRERGQLLRSGSARAPATARSTFAKNCCLPWALLIPWFIARQAPLEPLAQCKGCMSLWQNQGKANSHGKRKNGPRFREPPY